MKPDPDISGSRLKRVVVIVNQRGLHARASAKFVKCAARFAAEIAVTRDGHTVPGTSIMGLLALGASPGTEIEIAASGGDAPKAIEALVELVEGGFGET